jgi:hypothetical protein
MILLKFFYYLLLPSLVCGNFLEGFLSYFNVQDDETLSKNEKLHSFGKGELGSG